LSNENLAALLTDLSAQAAALSKSVTRDGDHLPLLALADSIVWVAKLGQGLGKLADKLQLQGKGKE
jgi:hypothetical protein